jgi:nucleotide-binding universal stress UspA family protein
MKTIIVPVDFSEQSELALKVAAQVAKKNDSQILALHMLELSDAIITASDGAHVNQAVFFLKLAEQKFDKFLQKDYLKDVKITPVVKHYKVYDEVNEIAKKHNADLIVMGSHGTDGLKEVFIGSNAEKMVRNSDVPVIVVKKELPNFDPKTIVFACDFDEENLMAFQKATAFANKFSANLDLVYINTPGDAFMSTEEIYAKISLFLNKAGVGEQVTIYNDYNVERGVLNYSSSVMADLIAIPTHGRKGLSHFFMGSIGEDIANHSEVPVVTFKI